MLKNVEKYQGHSLEKTTAYPFKEIIKNSETLPNGVIISRMPAEVSAPHRVFMAQMVAAQLGPSILTYPNIPIKAVHEALLQTGVEGLPYYVNSCPEIDDLLLGRHADHRTEADHVGDTYYFDVSRAGIYGAFNRSLGYVAHAEKKVRNSFDDVNQSWVKQYGVGVCAPLISFENLVKYARDNEARAYAIPVTSIAESLQVVSAMFPLAALEIMKVLQNDSWVGGNGSLRAKKSSRLYESLAKFIREKNSSYALNQLIFGQAGLDQLVNYYMENVEENFYLGSSADEITRNFVERTLISRSPHSHPSNGHQADVSEVVVRSLDRRLSPIPWEAMVILGDGQSTFEQLVKTANLLKSAQPMMEVVLICNNQGDPLKLDHVEGMVPSLAEYAVMGWSNHFLGRKCAQFVNKASSYQIT